MWHFYFDFVFAVVVVVVICSTHRAPSQPYCRCPRPVDNEWICLCHLPLEKTKFMQNSRNSQLFQLISCVKRSSKQNSYIFFLFAFWFSRTMFQTHIGTERMFICSAPRCSRYFVEMQPIPMAKIGYRQRQQQSRAKKYIYITKLWGRIDAKCARLKSGNYSPPLSVYMNMIFRRL